MITIRVLRFLAQECERQQSGEMSVYRMAMAFDYALSHHNAFGAPNPYLIRVLGKLVDNRNDGWRTTPVVFANGGSGLSAELIDEKIEQLCNNQSEMSPTEFYREFEVIHPFIDGNGRVGAILYNMLRDRMDEPVIPPKLFD